MTPSGRWVRTVDEARRFVLDVGLCLIFKGDGGRDATPSLWDVVDAPDRQPGESRAARDWLIWSLKNDLPMTYPDEIFYGKQPGGRAILCTLDYLAEVFPRQRRELDSLSDDARRLYGLIALRPVTNQLLRLDAGLHVPEQRGRFERALQELQVALQIARVDVDPDTWFPFDAVYPTLALRRPPAARSRRA